MFNTGLTLSDETATEVVSISAKVTIWVAGAVAGGTMGSVAMRTPAHYNAMLAAMILSACVVGMALAEYVARNVD